MLTYLSTYAMDNNYCFANFKYVEGYVNISYYFKYFKYGQNICNELKIHCGLPCITMSWVGVSLRQPKSRIRLSSSKLASSFPGCPNWMSTSNHQCTCDLKLFVGKIVDIRYSKQRRSMAKLKVLWSNGEAQGVLEVIYHIQMSMCKCKNYVLQSKKIWNLPW